MENVLDININWSVFDQGEKEILEKGIRDGQYEHLAAMIYLITPEKIAEIEKIQRQFRPRNFTFESTKQQEFESWLITHESELTPEVEAKWQAEIDKEKQEKLKQVMGNVVEATVINEGGTKTTSVQVSNNLKAVKGLSDISVKKLNTANVYSVEEFMKLSYEDKKRILGPLVAGKFKN